VRRATASVLAGTLALTGAALAAGVSPANALPRFDFERLAGTDRYGTAAAIALDDNTFRGGSTVVLASGATLNFPDALTGNYLAGEVDGPILLTDPSRLPGVTSLALNTLRPAQVVIVGGTNAVSSAVEAQVRAQGFVVTRIGGRDRYDTAELVAKSVATGGQRTGGPGAGTATATVGLDPQGRRTAVLGNGQDFPDILAAGPLGYAEAFPITITRPESLNVQTRRTLEALDVDQVLIVGGTTAVSAAVEAQVAALNGGTQVRRLAGQQRFETAISIANYEYDELGFDQSHVNMARSDDFADALSGGPHAGEDRAPIVLTTPTVLNPATKAFLESRGCTLRNGHIFGGTVAISLPVELEAEAAASRTDRCSAANQAAGNAATPTGNISVTPDAPLTATSTATVTATVNTVNGDSTTEDDRAFFIAGLIQGETYRITLVKCENVQGDGRNAMFKASPIVPATAPPTFGADTGTPTADIVRVNGVATSDTDAVTPGIQTGTTTFVASNTNADFIVDGDGAECIVPVVYFDSSTRDQSKGGASPRLELVSGPTGSFRSPSEEFDTGGRTTFVVR